ncbi:hypothetical protein SEA_DARTHPHADER_83 [Mycobacterium phage DarthPhader]|uniref:Gp84-like domain-containing protein n=1 Tax=Mycobacterium phage DarthPhader TaxID=1912975 RepID=A0A1I9S429_9CAUD|nr:hypothetical protein KIV60_gp18 [Mycobacterium phage DarthPhader]AOZ61323.1 hypothetical protein SEA_DARTHPHADER_83 [Mycobacterium phage DarthPhader]
MFTLTATRHRDDAEITISASHRQVLIDHLEASARRQGIVFDHVTNNIIDGGFLYLERDPINAVGTWEVKSA